MGGAVNSFTVADPAGNDIDEDTGFIGSAGFDLSDLLAWYFSAIWTEDGSVSHTMLNTIVSGDVPMGDGSFDYVVEGNWKQNDAYGGPTDDLWNITGYLGTELGPVSLAARADYTDDEESVLTGFDTSLWSTTLTAGYALVEGVTVRFEYRHDDADEDIFNDESSTGDTLDTLQAQLLWVPEI